MPEQAVASPIRVLIVDDLAVVRSGLRLFLRAFDDLLLVGEAADGEEAVRICWSTHPDVVLIDLDMPGMCSVAATRLMRYHFPGVQVVAMSSFQGERMLQTMLDNGAIGCLLKNISSDDLANAIRRAHRTPRPPRESAEPKFDVPLSTPCKGNKCPWGWRCRPLEDDQVERTNIYG